MGKLAKTSGLTLGAMAAGTAAIAVQLLVRSPVQSVKAAAFETAMLNVDGVAEGNTRSLQADAGLSSRTEQEVAPERGDFGQGSDDISSSGFAGAEGIEALEAAAKAASAGLARSF